MTERWNPLDADENTYKNKREKAKALKSNGTRANTDPRKRKQEGNRPNPKKRKHKGGYKQA